MGGSSSSGGGDARGKGAAQGAKNGYDFDRQVEASKSKGNNPGKDSLFGAIKGAIESTYNGGGTVDMSGFTPMGDYGGFGKGDGYSGGGGRDSRADGGSRGGGQ